MALDAAVNFAKAALASGITSGATSLTLVAGGGAKCPAVPFNATIFNSTDYSDPSDDPAVEIVRVTGISTDTLSPITRGQEGTTGVAHNTAGKTYTLIAGPTAKLVTDILGISITGSAATLTTPHAINGVNFDGWAPITINALPPAGIFTWANVTASRVAGTVYQNTSSFPMLVVGMCVSSGTGNCELFSDSSNPPTTSRSKTSNQSGYAMDVIAW